MWSGDITDTQEGILFEVFFSEHACVLLIGFRVASCCTVCVALMCTRHSYLHTHQRGFIGLLTHLASCLNILCTCTAFRLM